MKVAVTCPDCGSTRDVQRAHALQIGRGVRSGRCVPCGHRFRVATTRRDLEERFWSKVEKTSSCWAWLGATSDGYGHIRHRRRTIRAHRLAYELLVGPIPEGLTIDHLCRNRACCNPDHLEPVTNLENLRRGRLTHCFRGHPYDDANTYWNGSRRICNACRRVRYHERAMHAAREARQSAA